MIELVRIINNRNLEGMFYGYISLILLPDISKWNANNLVDMSGVFCKCSSLKSLGDDFKIEKFRE